MSAFKAGDLVRVKSMPEIIGTVRRFITPSVDQPERSVVVAVDGEFVIRRFESELELVPKRVIVTVGDKLSTGANTVTIIGLNPAGGCPKMLAALGPGIVWLLDDDDVRHGSWGPDSTRKLPYTFTIAANTLFNPSRYTTEDGRKIDGVSYR